MRSLGRKPCDPHKKQENAMLRRTFLAIAALLLTACADFAQKPEGAAPPPSGGFSSERLERLDATLRAEVGTDRIPGGVLLIARNGKIVYEDVVGWQDPQAKKPMQKDAIFRIASMSKPIVSVAVMQLVEQGRIQLTDPVSKYLPQLADLS